MLFQICRKKGDFPLEGRMKTATSAYLEWENIPQAEGYNIYDGFRKINQKLITETTFLATHQKPDRVHTYRVAAVIRRAERKISSPKKIGLVHTKTPTDLGEGACQISISDLALRLRYIGPVVSDPQYHYWCTSAIEDEAGKTHIFTSRVPKSWKTGFDPGWKQTCEIAHFVGDSPEGPFREVEIVFSNENLPKGKMWSPHNSKITKIDDTYCLLFIVQTSASVDTQKTVLATSKSLYGPWEFAGENGFILDLDRRIVNPDLIKVRDKYHLYFKSTNGDVLAFYVAVAENLTGPYTIKKEPITENDKRIEDLDVFSYQNKVYILSTDNHGISGYVGAGLLWESEDGLRFDAENIKLGFGRLSDYIEIPKGRTFSYGNVKHKHERPEVLLRDGKPAYFYAPSGTSVDGIGVCQNYIYKIEKDI